MIVSFKSGTDSSFGSFNWCNITHIQRVNDDWSKVQPTDIWGRRLLFSPSSQVNHTIFVCWYYWMMLISSGWTVCIQLTYSKNWYFSSKNDLFIIIIFIYCCIGKKKLVINWHFCGHFGFCFCGVLSIWPIHCMTLMSIRLVEFKCISVWRQYAHFTSHFSKSLKVVSRESWD